MSDACSNSAPGPTTSFTCAKIVLAAWRQDLDREDIPATTLAQAFQGGAREHLVAAYGWFLLAISQVRAASQGPPRGCHELPAMPAGKVYPAEIKEFRQLEPAAGWELCCVLPAVIFPPVASRATWCLLPATCRPRNRWKAGCGNWKR